MPGVGLEPTTTGLTDQKTLLLAFHQNTLIRALSTELPWHMLRQAGVEPAIDGSLFNLAVCDPYSPHFLYRCVDRFTTAADIDFWGKIGHGPFSHTNSALHGCASVLVCGRFHSLRHFIYSLHCFAHGSFSAWYTGQLLPMRMVSYSMTPFFLVTANGTRTQSFRPRLGRRALHLHYIC